MNILVTSSGGPAAVGVIKSIRKLKEKHKIVATDINELSVGLEMADESYIVPSVEKDFFFEAIHRLIIDENIDVILPTGNLEIEKFEPLSKITKVFMSDSKTIKLCNDKFEFYEKTKKDFDLPKTWLENGKLKGECFAKPRFEVGGSRGVKFCRTMNDIICAHQADSEYVFQDYLPGQEYTIDVLCDMDSNPLIAIPRKRLETKAGISSKGEIISDEYIIKECKRLCKFLSLKGPVCIQMKEDDNGKPKFIEVNPRFGGGSYFSTLAGVNFVEIIIRILEGKEIFISEPKKIKVIRYFEEIVI